MLNDNAAITAVAVQAPPTLSRRRTLHASALGLVEDFHLTADCAAQSGHSPEYQVVLPYEGAVNWRVGANAAMLDSNSVLFVGADEDFSESHLVAGVGHASIIITPRLSMLQELCAQRVPAQHAGFKKVAGTKTPRAQVLLHRLMHLTAAGSDSLEGDELTIAILREALKRLRKQYGAVHPDIAFAVCALSDVALDRHRYGEAERVVRDALEGHEWATKEKLRFTSQIAWVLANQPDRKSNV